MKGAAEVLLAARELGIDLIAEGEYLRYSAPPGVLTSGLLTELKRHKPELLALLSAPETYPCGMCGRFAFAEPRTCYWCTAAQRLGVTA